MYQLSRAKVLISKSSIGEGSITCFLQPSDLIYVHSQNEFSFSPNQGGEGWTTNWLSGASASPRTFFDKSRVLSSNFGVRVEPPSLRSCACSGTGDRKMAPSRIRSVDSCSGGWNTSS